MLILKSIFFWYYIFVLGSIAGMAILYLIERAKYGADYPRIDTQDP